MVTRWRDVGSYRRALSAYDVKVGAVPCWDGRSTSRRRTSRWTASSTRPVPGTRVRTTDVGRLGLRPRDRSQRPRPPGAPPWPSRPPPRSTTSSPSPSAGGSSSLRRDLRRHPVRLGLRPARCRAQGEHQAPVVALDGPVARGRRRPGLQRDPAAPDLGGLRPRRHVHRPADRVPVLPQAVPGRPPAGGVRREEGHRRPRRRRPRRRSPAPTAAPAARGPSRGSSPGCSRPTSASSRTSPACTTCAPRPRRASSSTSPTW